VQGEGDHPLLERRQSWSGKSEGLHKRSAEAWGDSLRARGGGATLRKACLPYGVRVSAPDLQGGRCGRERPAEVGNGEREAFEARAGDILPSSPLLLPVR